jgi:predicted dehydrogenase
MKTTSRRSFLTRAGATAAAPFILPSGMLRAENAPGNKLGVGFIGMGKQMGGHLSHFLGRDDAQVIAVCDVDTTRREFNQKRANDSYAKSLKKADYNGVAAYNDYRELIARKDIDTIVIATPDHWHGIIATAAVNAGKDVYCEKPLTHNIHESLVLVDATRKNNRVFQTGSMQRSSAEFRVACELVRNNVFGKIKTITTQFGDPAKPNANPEEAMEPGLDWDMWCGPGPKVPYSSVLSPRGVHNHFPAWRMTREFGGGMITDWGAHHIDIAQWGLGEDGHGPVEVIAPADYENAKRGAKLVYSNGVVLTHGDGFGVSFYCEQGEVHVNRGKIKVITGGETKYYFDGKDEACKKTTLLRELAGIQQAYLQDAKVKLYATKKSHHDDFVDAIRARTRPICDVEIGASSAISCHLMNFAYWHGANIKWDPANHKFISGGDDKWLTREYRGPFSV